MYENEISGLILDCTLKIHQALGPGLLESVYEEILAYELRKRKLVCDRQVGFPVQYKEIHLHLGFRADLIVDRKVVVELKSVETLMPVHRKQLLTYLKLTGSRLGLLLNFNVELMKDGIIRVVNNL
jgi:GxxExxY protein